MLKRYFHDITTKIKGRRKPILMVNGLLLMLAGYFLLGPSSSSAPPPPPHPQQPEKGASQVASEPEAEIIRGQITKNMTLSGMLTSNGFAHEIIHQLVAACKPVYNLKKLIIGNRFELERLPDGTLGAFRYVVDLDKYLEVLSTSDGFLAQLHAFEYDERVFPVVGTIESSLFRTISDLKEADQLALDMAEIFSWDIDFNTEIQRGDHFRLMVEKLYLDERFVKYGDILAVEFYNAGKLFTGYRFEDPEGESGYFDKEGRSLKRDFLKSPVKFSRISSGFSYRRFHPILKKRRPHLGVDYAAPRGTPVVAAGNGRIHFRGWKGGFGKYVQIKHSNGFTTSYAHLSRFARGLRRGVRVTQGQVIGYVGSTGLSTGPHLDYRVTRNGVFVNPLSLKIKPSKPLKPEYQPAFHRFKRKWQRQLAALGPPPGRLQSASLVPTFEAEFIY